MKLITFEIIDSTNSWALENFEKLDDKTVISADCQTSGKGRFNRVWISDSTENIYATVVLKPSKKQFLSNLTQYFCVVVVRVLEKYGVNAEIKWPNDILVHGKKICGILAESYLKHNKIQGIVLGIGVNLNTSIECLDKINKPATSLNIVLNKKINKNEFFNLLLDEFFTNYDKIIELGFLAIKDEYTKRLKFINQKIDIQQRDGGIIEQVFAQKVDDKGNLIVLSSDGKEKVILSGDILF